MVNEGTHQLPQSWSTTRVRRSTPHQAARSVHRPHAKMPAHPSLTSRVRPVERNASTHNAASADSSHKLASSDWSRTSIVAGFAALGSAPDDEQDTCVQFHNRLGLRKTVFQRLFSCSTFRASRTIEHRERRECHNRQTDWRPNVRRAPAKQFDRSTSCVQHRRINRQAA